MSFNINDNDDDLFNDSSTLSSSSDSSAYSDVQSLIDSIPKDELKNISDIAMRAKMSIALYQGSHSFIYNTSSYNRSIFNTLNQLTDGSFQYNLYADVLEESIIRRLIILDFVDGIVFSDNDHERALEKIGKVLNINIDERFIRTYFVSFHRLLTSSIDYNIEVYKSVCSHINREPSSFVIEKNISDASYMTLSSDSYINSIFSNMRRSFGFGVLHDND
jgi:hypothetical protein